jgi:hypothetical protein
MGVNLAPPFAFPPAERGRPEEEGLELSSTNVWREREGGRGAQEKVINISYISE